MKALLDSHALIWMAADPDRLGTNASSIILDNKSELYVSMATFWELSIKISLGKLSLNGLTLDDLKSYLFDNAISILPIQYHHCQHVISLPFHHKDPFDRLLISQALVENFSVVSNDRLFKQYSIDVIW